jgi:hypothetical protein
MVVDQERCGQTTSFCGAVRRVRHMDLLQSAGLDGAFLQSQPLACCRAMVQTAFAVHTEWCQLHTQQCTRSGARHTDPHAAAHKMAHATRRGARAGALHAVYTHPTHPSHTAQLGHTSTANSNMPTVEWTVTCVEMLVTGPEGFGALAYAFQKGTTVKFGAASASAAATTCCAAGAIDVNDCASRSDLRT